MKRSHGPSWAATALLTAQVDPTDRTRAVIMLRKISGYHLERATARRLVDDLATLAATGEDVLEASDNRLLETLLDIVTEHGIQAGTMTVAQFLQTLTAYHVGFQAQLDRLRALRVDPPQVVTLAPVVLLHANDLHLDPDGQIERTLVS